MNLNKFLSDLTRRVLLKHMIQELVQKNIIQYQYKIHPESFIGILGLHGKFERGISEIVTHLAQQLQCNYFLFQTPIHFPSSWIHPEAVPELKQFLDSVQFIISIHGTSRTDLFVGGQHQTTITMSINALRSVKWNKKIEVFSAIRNQDIVGHLAGLNEENLVNYPLRKGIQLELPMFMRINRGEQIKLYCIMNKLYPELVKIIKGDSDG